MHILLLHVFGMMELLILLIHVKYLEWHLQLHQRMIHNLQSLEFLECKNNQLVNYLTD